MMNISLTPELEQIISRKIQSGLYKSPDEVIYEGLRLLEQADASNDLHFQELKREITIGIEQADCGQVKLFDPESLLQRVTQQIEEG